MRLAMSRLCCRVISGMCGSCAMILARALKSATCKERFSLNPMQIAARIRFVYHRSTQQSYVERESKLRHKFKDTKLL